MPIIATVVTTTVDIMSWAPLLIAKTGGILTESVAIDNYPDGGGAVVTAARLIVEGMVASAEGDAVTLYSPTSGANSVTITESGSVTTGFGYRAIYMEGNNGQLVNAGSISGPTGVDMNGNNCWFQNTGSIAGTTGPAVWLRYGTGFTLVNSGVLSGKACVVLSFASGSIFNSGQMLAASAVDAAILVTSTSTLFLRNSGEIVAPTKAIQAGGEADTIFNTGTIDGDVFLGGGNDSFRGKPGKLTGTLSGDAGVDFLSGGKGDQLIFGGTENDTLSGDAGDDTLFGGNGYDTFVFSRRGDDDTISVFQNGTDTLDVKAFHFANFAAVAAISRDAPGGMLLDLQSVGGGTVFLGGFTKALFNATDVLL